MKTKFFLLIGIFTIALTACEGDDNNGDDPTKPLDDAQISFTKMANCPDAEVDQAIVWKDAIYYVNRTSFLRYTPARNEWQSLAPAPSTNLFVWQDKLYCPNGNLDFYVYSAVTEAWEPTTDIAAITDNHFGKILNIGNTLFRIGNSGYYCMFYQSDSREWKYFDGQYSTCSFPFEYSCEIEGKGYSFVGIYLFDPETRITTLKVNIPSKGGTISGCLYNQRQMLYSQCSVSRYDKEDIYATIGIYTPSTNEYNEMTIESKVPNGATNVTQVDIPMVINLLTYFDGRNFVGPNNAAFYELKIR